MSPELFVLPVEWGGHLRVLHDLGIVVVSLHGGLEKVVMREGSATTIPVAPAMVFVGRSS